METTALFDLARKIADEMTAQDGHPWSIEDRRDRMDGPSIPWPVIVGHTPRASTPAALIVREGYDVGAGRVEFRATAERLAAVDLREYPTPPAVTVRADRDPHAIARDVLRRIAADAAEFADATAQVTARIQTAENLRDRTAAELAAYVGGRVIVGGGRTEPTPTGNVTVYAPNGGPRFDVSPSGRIRADMHAHPRTARQAADLAALVASWEN